MYAVTLRIVDARHPLAGRIAAGSPVPNLTLEQARAEYVDLVAIGSDIGGQVLRDNGRTAYVRCGIHNVPDAAGSCYIVAMSRD